MPHWIESTTEIVLSPQESVGERMYQVVENVL
jgi:hypothetical protein